MRSELFELSVGAGRSALFVLAHPDDEFFCLPLIAAEARRGHGVELVYLTDGGPLASTRERETLSVLARLGVAPEAVHFAGHAHGWQDGRLHERVREAYGWVEAKVASLPDCARIYVPAYEGGHHDHDSCFAIVAALGRRGRAGRAELFQFPLYNGRGTPGPLFRCMAPIPENGPVQGYPFGLREAWRCWSFSLAYPSQWRTWIALGPFAIWGLLFRRTITLQRVDLSRGSGAPHSGKLYYERRFGVPQAALRSSLGALLDHGR